MTTTTATANIFPTPACRGDVRTAMDWLERAFGFEKHLVGEEPDRGIVHAEMRLGPGVIMFGAPTPSIYVYVPDADAVYGGARAAGAEITTEIRDTDYGARVFSCRDFEGNEWHLGTYLPENLPAGEPSIFPVLRYEDCPRAIEWLVQAFGFEKLMEVGEKDGGIAYAELALGPGVVMLGSMRNEPNNPWAATRQGIYAAVPEVDAHYERAKSAGAEIIRPIEDMDYGSREYSARDSEGNLWSFGTYRPTR